MKKTELVRMSFSIEEELSEQLETLLVQSGYDNRSEFIRDMIRKQLTRKLCSVDGKVIGTISVLCNLNSSGIEAKLNKVLDDSVPRTLGMSRFALDENASTVMITVEGIGNDIRELVNSIRKLKGIIQAEFVITSVAGCQHR
ncbi:MAG: ribbon-helix-helix protein, CopG family [Lentisphaerae bacterium]|nr:ribbon-helix-helix protein, CopG family [Lentisphaerota bacterium]